IACSHPAWGCGCGMRSVSGHRAAASHAAHHAIASSTLAAPMKNISRCGAAASLTGRTGAAPAPGPRSWAGAIGRVRWFPWPKPVSMAARAVHAVVLLPEHRGCDDAEACLVVDFQFAAVQPQQAVVLEALEHPADRLRSQAQVVGDLGARHGQLEPVG